MENIYKKEGMTRTEYHKGGKIDKTFDPEFYDKSGRPKEIDKNSPF